MLLQTSADVSSFSDEKNNSLSLVYNSSKPLKKSVSSFFKVTSDNHSSKQKNASPYISETSHYLSRNVYYLISVIPVIVLTYVQLLLNVLMVSLILNST